MTNELGERLAAVETKIEIMAPKVDAMYVMMLEQRGAKKAIWGILKNSKTLVAGAAALAMFCVSKYDHLIALFRS